MNMDRPVRKRVRVYACRGEQEKEVARVVTNVETNIKKHIAEDNASLHALMILSCPEFEEAGVIPKCKVESLIPNPKRPKKTGPTP